MRKISFIVFLLFVIRLLGNDVNNIKTKSSDKNVAKYKNIEFWQQAYSPATANYSTPKTSKKLDQKNKTVAIPNLRGNGMQFISNKGQLIDSEGKLRPDILFKGDGRGTDVYLRNTGISYVLSNMNEVNYEINEQVEELIENGKLNYHEDQTKKQELFQKATIKTHRVDVDFLNANTNYEIETEQQVEGYNNYYYPHCKDGITHVNAYNLVIQKNIYNNIDVAYYGGKANGLKYDIIVNPFGNPNNIQLKYTGTKGVKLKNGKLQIETSLGNLGEYMPKVYQLINGKEVNVSAEYILSTLDKVGEAAISFKLGTYNPKYSLIIDPWITYFGGSSVEIGASITTDGLGNSISTGEVQSVNFPALAGAGYLVFQNSINGGVADAFVAKFNSSGVRLMATYIGGNNYDFASGITTDASNNIIFTGYTASSNFPVGFSGINVVHQGTFAGVGDAFLFKLDPTGVRLFSTFYGGINDEGTGDVFTNGSDIYLGGYTMSTNNISTIGAFQPVISPGGFYDGFVAKFTANGTRILGTYFGGSNSDEYLLSITCDPVGNVLACGKTISNNFPVSSAFQNLYGGNGDAFVLKLSAAGGLLWSTYYGGNNDDYGFVICTDASSNVYLGGRTSSTSGISTAGSYQPIFWGTDDAFVIKFSPGGTRIWGTYLGGPTQDYCTGIACDLSGNVIVSGDTYGSMSFSTTACAYKSSSPTGGEVQFLGTIDPNGQQLLCFTYIGSSTPTHNETENGLGGSLALYGCNAYIVGSSWCNYPVTAGAWQIACGGSKDMVISQLDISSCGIPPPLSLITSTVSAGCSCSGAISLSLSAGCKLPPFSYSLSNGMQVSNTNNKSANFTGLCGGNYNYTVTTACDTTTSSFFIGVPASSLTVNFSSINPPPCAGSTGSIIINSITNGVPNYTLAEGTTTLASNIVTSHTLSGVSVGSHTYVLTDGNGCSSSFTTTITAPSPTLNLSVVSPVMLNCNPATQTLIATSTATGSLIYFWAGPGITSGANTSNPVVSLAGNYTVTLTQGPCTNSAIIVVTSNTNMPNVSITNVSTLTCSNSSLIVIGTSTTTGVSYSWSPLGVTTSSAFITTPGNYTLDIIHIASGCKTNSLISITQNTILASVNISPITNLNCLITSATLVANSPGNNSVWNGPGLTNGVNPTIVNTPGTYSVTVTNTTNGCVSNSVVTITQNTAVPNVLVSVSNSITCNMPSAVLTASSSLNSAIYQWINGPSNATQIVTVGGNYSLSVTNPINSCVSSTQVIVFAAPVLSANVNVLSQINCFGNNSGALQIAVLSGGTAPFSITNLNTGSSINNVSSFPIVLSSLSAANYSILVSDANGCKQTLFATITQPAPLNLSLGGNTTLCEGQSSTISSGVTGGSAPYSYVWSPSGGNGPNLTISPNANTTFSLFLTDNNGCQAQASIAIVVNPKPSASLVNNKLVGCSPVCAGFSLSAIQQPGYIYTWQFTNNQSGSVTSSQLYQPDLCFKEPGVYNVGIVIATALGCSTTLTYNNLIQVYQKPNADFSFSPERPTFLEPSVQLTNLSSGASAYAWFNSNMISPFSIQSNPGYVFPDAGEYLIILIASNGSCSDTTLKTIIVEDEFLFYAPNAFTPNEDNLNDTWFPLITGYKEGSFNLVIFDRWGEQLYQSNDPTSKGWDGFYKKELCKDDVYVWKASVKDKKGKLYQFMGHVSLLK